MSNTPLIIPRRYNGPPDSGNGGYTCGVIALAVGQTVRVRLQQPPPLETPLTVQRGTGDEWQLRNGTEVLARAVPAAVDVCVPAPPAFEAAVEASRHYPSAETHDLPQCFVCGPAREPGDGLRIFAAPVPGMDLVAAPWMPEPALADEGGVKPEFIWAALDCPGAFASQTRNPSLLGELTVRIERRPAAAERYVVIGWRIGNDGRKHYAGTALYGADRRLCAVGVATWIELKA